MKTILRTIIPALLISIQLAACRYDRPMYMKVRDIYPSADSLIENGLGKEALKEIFSQFTDEEILSDDSLMLLQRKAYFSVIPCTGLKKIGKSAYSVARQSGDGGKIIVADYEDAILRFLSGDSLKETRTVATGFEPMCVSASPDGSLVATGKENGGVDIYEIETGKLIKSYKPHMTRTRSIVWGNGNLIYSCGNDRAVAAYDLKGDSLRWMFRKNYKNVKDIDTSPDGSVIITASNDGVAFVLDSAGHQLHRIVNGKNYCNTAIVFPDKSRFATAGAEGNVRIFNAKTLNQEGSFVAFKGVPVWKMTITPDGKMIAAAAYNTVSVINTLGPELSYAIPYVAPSQIMDLTFDSDGNLIFVTEDGCIGRIIFPSDAEQLRLNHQLCGDQKP